MDLDQIRIASPCTESWDRMQGDQQVRFCSRCEMSVFNLSEMSLDEIRHVVESKEGRTCIRFYRRPDGKILTGDCPVGVRALRRCWVKMVAGAAAFVSLITFGLLTVTVTCAVAGGMRPMPRQGPAGEDQGSPRP